MSLFSEMAALKAAMQLRGLAKVSFHLRFTYVNTLGRETSSCCKVVVGCRTPFSDFLRIYCEARSHFEVSLPPNARAKRAYRNLFLKHFRRNMFYNMNLTACYGDLVFDCRLPLADCIALVYDVTSPRDAIPRISKTISDPRLILWEEVPYQFSDLSCYPKRSLKNFTNDQT